MKQSYLSVFITALPQIFWKFTFFDFLIFEKNPERYTRLAGSSEPPTT